MNQLLSGRNVQVIAKLAVCKWLATSQLRRLYFADVTADAACKVLRQLRQRGYLVVYRENRMAEALHGVGPKGKALLAAKGLEVDTSRTPPRQLQHLVEINEVRVALEVCPSRLGYFFACWELGRLGWRYPVIPDGIFGLQDPRRCKFALELDRGTEPLSVLSAKLQVYGRCASMLAVTAVILVTEHDGRLRLLQQRLEGGGCQLPILGTSLADIRNRGMYAAVFRIMCDAQAPNRGTVALFDFRPHVRALWQHGGEVVSDLLS